MHNEKIAVTWHNGGPTVHQLHRYIYTSNMNKLHDILYTLETNTVLNEPSMIIDRYQIGNSIRGCIIG